MLFKYLFLFFLSRTPIMSSFRPIRLYSYFFFICYTLDNQKWPIFNSADYFTYSNLQLSPLMKFHFYYTFNSKIFWYGVTFRSASGLFLALHTQGLYITGPSSVSEIEPKSKIQAKYHNDFSPVPKNNFYLFTGMTNLGKYSSQIFLCYFLDIIYFI